MDIKFERIPLLNGIFFLSLHITHSKWLPFSQKLLTEKFLATK